MDLDLEHVVDRWIKVDWEDAKLDSETKDRFSAAITEILELIQNENI